MALSSLASKPIEAAIAASPTTFFQIYWLHSTRATRAYQDDSRVVVALSSDMYKSWFSECTIHGVEVSVTELRAHLSDWLDRARAGGEVVITDRGIPVARLSALDSAGTLERLTAEGVIGKATAQRPVAAGRSRPRPRRPVSDRVSDQRR
jgi:prevent-host-death family protein